MGEGSPPPYPVGTGPLVLSETGSRTFAGTARICRSSPRRAVLLPEGSSPELGLEGPMLTMPKLSRPR